MRRLPISIFYSSPSAPLQLPKLQFQVNRFSRRAMGGSYTAEIIARGDPGLLWILTRYVNYYVHIHSPGMQVVWSGYIESVVVDADKKEAEIFCQGRIHKLTWNYYANPLGLLEFMDSTGERHNLSDGAGITQVAQSFTYAGTAWSAYSVGIIAGVVGTRIDNLVIEIQSDSSNQPSGTVLATTSSITAATVAGTDGYIEAALDTPVTVDSTRRWVVVRATGGTDTANFFTIGVNSANTTTLSGRFMFYIPSTWWPNRQDNNKAADMNIKLIGSTETSTQMATIITDAATYTPSAFSGSDIYPASSVASSEYRDGLRTHWQCVKELCETGNSAGRRYLCDVTPSGRFYTWLEPEEPAVPHVLMGKVRVGVSIKRMANRVASIYTTQATGATSTATSTAFLTDVESIARYGTKSSRISGNDQSAASASQRVTTTLAVSRYPHAVLDSAGSSKIRILSPGGGYIDPCTCPVGYWARVGAIGAAQPDIEALRYASLMFIEEAEYDATSDTYTATPRNTPNVLDLVKIEGT